MAAQIKFLEGSDQINTLASHFSKKFTICDTVFCHNRYVKDDDLFTYIKVIYVIKNSLYQHPTQI